MNDALFIGATGMQAQQLQLEAIANNLANMNTPAYKRSRITFSEIVQRTGAVPGAEEGTAAAVGVASSGSTRAFDAGELRKTDSAMDIAVQGAGFLEVLMPDGTRAFTRGGTLKIGSDGQLATLAGYPLKPGLAVPEGLDDLRVSSGGRVQARAAGRSDWAEIGQLEMVRFQNAQGLVAHGANLYRHTDASGEPIAGRPAEDGFGSLVQGSLESSNVKLVDELVQLMMAQRAYEASLKVVQAGDELLGLVNGMRK